MKPVIQAACGCNVGKIRKNNEDNFYFDGSYLPQDNSGLAVTARWDIRLKSSLSLAVFDGMGGENFGEAASFAAARAMAAGKPAGLLVPRQGYLEKLTLALNDAVVRSKKEHCTEHMGTTMVILHVTSRYGYVCNVGDSRAYRLRGGELLQLSQDHVIKRPGKSKAPLTQHLGIDPEEMLLEPYIVREPLKKGDTWLLCSDGLTDMLPDGEIAHILLASPDAAVCVERLIQGALEQGGRDNVTAIVCKIL